MEAILFTWCYILGVLQIYCVSVRTRKTWQRANPIDIIAIIRKSENNRCHTPSDDPGTNDNNEYDENILQNKLTSFFLY